MKPLHAEQGAAEAATAVREDLAAALAAAALSPSSHNSQPWEVLVVESEARRLELRRWLRERPAALEAEPEAAWLLVALDRDRCLRALPSFELEMNLSCGAYLESLWLGLEARGRAARIAWTAGEDGSLPPLPEGWPGSWRAVALVRVGQPRPAGPAPAAVADAARLRGRITNRGPYAAKAVGGDIQACLAAAGSGAFPEADAAFKLVAIQDPAVLARLGAFVAATADAEFEDAAAWEETYRHLRFGDESGEATGLPVSQLFGPVPAWARRLLQAVLAPASMRRLKRLGLPRLLAHQLGGLVGAAPLAVLLVSGVENPGPDLQLAAGGRLLRAWLAATGQGLAWHPVSVVLQHAALRQRLEREFGLPGRALFLARAGIPLQPFPPAPKRAVAWDNLLII